MRYARRDEVSYVFTTDDVEQIECFEQIVDCLLEVANVVIEETKREVSMCGVCVIQSVISLVNQR